MHTKTFIPPSPRLNPSLEEGVHEVAVASVELRTYGEHNSPLVRIILRLTESDRVLVTHIYFPNNDAPGSSQRLWHFCQCVGLETSDVREQPELFKERRLRVFVRPFSRMPDDSEDCYSDVSAFLPVDWEEEVESYEVW